MFTPHQIIAFVGLAVWLLGAMSGEGVIFAGTGVAALAWLLSEHAGAASRWWRGVAAVFFCAALVSALWAPHPLRSGAPWSELHWLAFPLALVLLRRIGEGERRALLGVFAVLVVFTSVLACMQHWFAIFDVVWLAKVFSVARVMEPAPNGGFKAGGLHFHRLRFAHTLIPLCLACLPALWRRGARVGVWVLCGFAGVALAYTYARAVWVALAVGALGFFVRGRALRALMLLSVLAVPLLSFVWPGRHWPEDRAFAWHSALQLFLAHPFFGVGAGGYARAAQLRFGINAAYPLIYIDAHALLLQLLAELGLFGAGLWLAISGRFVWALSARATPVLFALAAIGIVHNWAFHPVVTVAAAFAVAFAATEEPAPARHAGFALFIPHT